MLGCSKSSVLIKTDGFICLNHQNHYDRKQCAREKTSLIFEWLTYCQKNNNINNSNLVNIAADQMIKDNQRLLLSPNLLISVSKTQHVTSSNHLNNCSIDFVNEGYTKIGDQVFLRKTYQYNSSRVFSNEV